MSGDLLIFMMKLPPYNIFPNISGDKISIRQIMTADIRDLVEISFYDAFQAAIELLERLNFIKVADFDGNEVEYEFRMWS